MDKVITENDRLAHSIFVLAGFAGQRLEQKLLAPSQSTDGGEEGEAFVVGPVPVDVEIAFRAVAPSVEKAGKVSHVHIEIEIFAHMVRNAQLPIGVLESVEGCQAICGKWL